MDVKHISQVCVVYQLLFTLFKDSHVDYKFRDEINYWTKNNEWRILINNLWKVGKRIDIGHFLYWYRSVLGVDMSITISLVYAYSLLLLLQIMLEWHFPVLICYLNITNSSKQQYTLNSASKSSINNMSIAINTEWITRFPNKFYFPLSVINEKCVSFI